MGIILVKVLIVVAVLNALLGLVPDNREDKWNHLYY